MSVSISSASDFSSDYSHQENYPPPFSPSQLADKFTIVQSSKNLDSKTLELALCVAKVIIVLDEHNDNQMHQLNGEFINAYWRKGDRLLYEGNFEHRPQEVFGTPTKYIHNSILKISNSWDISDPSVNLSFLHQYAYAVLEVLRSLIITKQLEESGSFDPMVQAGRLASAWITLKQFTPEDMPSKEKIWSEITHHSFKDRISYIENIASQANAIYRNVQEKIHFESTCKFSERTDSMIHQLSKLLSDDKVGRIWITCGRSHGEMYDPLTQKYVQKLYTTLRNKALSFVVIRKEVPTSSLPQTLGPNRPRKISTENQTHQAVLEKIDALVKYEHQLQEISQEQNDAIMVLIRLHCLITNQLKEASVINYLSYGLSLVCATQHRIHYWAIQSQNK